MSELFPSSETFYAYLFKVKDHTNDFSMVQPGLRNNTHRALSVIGYICRHYNNLANSNTSFANDNAVALDPTYCNIIDSELISESNFFDASFSCIMSFLKKRDAQTKCCALRSMTGLFIAKPRVFLCVEQMGSIDTLISNEAPSELKCEALKCFKEILMVRNQIVRAFLSTPYFKPLILFLYVALRKKR